MHNVHGTLGADMPKEKQPVHMLFEPELLKRIDDFRFKNRFESRTESIKWLLDWALNQKPAVAKGE